MLSNLCKIGLNLCQMGDPDDGEMIGMTNNEVKKYAAVEETNGRINTHIINQEQVSRRPQLLLFLQRC
jgi:hypothetical protein